jgi:hyaluronan synthase
MVITFVLALDWPRSESYAGTTIAAAGMWAWAMACRIFTIKRSDQSFLGRLGAVALNPAASFWVLIVLRAVRVYGTLTFLRQGWTTRSRVEVGAEMAVLKEEARR